MDFQKTFNSSEAAQDALNQTTNIIDKYKNNMNSETIFACSKILDNVAEVRNLSQGVSI
jgi:hypothetical protein